ncbi:hypothetical protein ACFL20_07315 [Spirochaetota bacterium]
MKIFITKTKFYLLAIAISFMILTQVNVLPLHAVHDARNGGGSDCSACHDVMGGSSIGGPLIDSSIAQSNLCLSCHGPGGSAAVFDPNYEITSLHTGPKHSVDTTCTDCHTPHVGDAGSNIRLIEPIISTPNSGDLTVTFGNVTGTNSFADGLGNGICEVCHTNTTVFLNTGNPAGTHDGREEGDCTGCHDHASSDGFSPSGGSCGFDNGAGCHGDSNVTMYAHRKHTNYTDTNSPYNFACSTCHNNSGHNNGTIDISFSPSGLAKRGGLDSNTPEYIGEFPGGFCTDPVYKIQSDCESNGETWTEGGFCHNSSITASNQCKTSPWDTWSNPYCQGLSYTSVSTCTSNGGTWVGGECSNGSDLTKNDCDSSGGTWSTDGLMCSNVYCHSTGTTADRGTGGGYTWSSTTNTPYATPVYTIAPSWKTGSINSCDACHAGKGSMTYPFTISETGPVTATADYPDTGSHAPNRGAHSNNKYNLATWTNAQCFWCHSSDGLGKNTGETPLQGSYGTNLHVDGETYFIPLLYENNGTMIINDYSEGHCGSGKTCW